MLKKILGREYLLLNLLIVLGLFFAYQARENMRHCVRLEQRIEACKKELGSLNELKQPTKLLHSKRISNKVSVPLRTVAIAVGKVHKSFASNREDYVNRFKGECSVEKPKVSTPISRPLWKIPIKLPKAPILTGYLKSPHGISLCLNDSAWLKEGEEFNAWEIVHIGSHYAILLSRGAMRSLRLGLQ